MILLVLNGICVINSKFGEFGFNPALASAYIAFECGQAATPNALVPNDQLNHYLWAYMIGPICGGAIAGFLHIIHAKCAKAKGHDNDMQDSKLIE